MEYLGVDLGELFDSAGLLPSDFLYDEDDEDDAASTTSTSTSSSSTGMWGGGGHQAGGGGGGGWGGGGGVRDLAAVMMFQPRRLQRLKRRYEQLLRIALQVSAAGGGLGADGGGGGGVEDGILCRCLQACWYLQVSGMAGGWHVFGLLLIASWLNPFASLPQEVLALQPREVVCNQHDIVTYDDHGCLGLF